MSDDIGKFLVSTQNELRYLKNELELVSSPQKEGKSAEEYENAFNRIKDYLTKFEGNIQNKVDQIVTSAMVNNENTLNKLPLIQTTESSTNRYDNTKDARIGSEDYRINKSQTTFPEIQKDPRYKHYNRMIMNPQSTAAQTILRGKFQLPIQKKTNTELKPFSTTKQSDLKKTVGKISKPLGVLPKSLRNDPFAVAPINQSDIKQGMLSLINRGLIPRDVDLTPAFERGQAPFSIKKGKIHQGDEKNMKTEISSFPPHLYNVKFDANYLENPEAFTKKIQTQELKKTHTTSQPYQISLNENLKAIATRTEKSQKPQDFQVNLEKAKAKQYEEVLDVYSLHQFIIRKGRTLAETPEFQSYKRTFFGIWDSIENIIHHLEKLLTDYDIRVAYIDGKKLAMLAESTYKKPTPEELLDCIINQEDINKIIKIPKNMFKGQNGRLLAITKVQALFRMFKARKTYKRVKVLIDKVSVIQKCAKLFLKYRGTVNKIKERKEGYFNKFKELQEKFKDDWPQLKMRKRVEIHINSLSYEELQRLSMEKYMQKQNMQIARLFNLKDPLVDVIYVAPFDMPPEVMSYYNKVFELGGIENANTRFTIIWPENHILFPSHYSTSKVLLYSPKCLKRIRQLTKGKNAFIIPGVPSSEDIELSATLEMPLFCGEPQKNYFYSTKSGAKTIFNSCEMPVPAGSFNIYDEKEFVLTLTKLIAYNLEVNTWIFKIDNEQNGRGHASFSVDQVKPLLEIRRKNFQVGEDLILKIHEIVSAILPNKIKIAMPHLYRNYGAYIQDFVKKGGVIEAAPNSPSSQVASTSIGFRIDPVGDITVLGSYDKFFAHEYVSAGCFYPQKSVPNINLQAICDTVGKALYQKGIFGFITIDIITFPDPSGAREGKEFKGNRLFWAIDLNCYLTNSVAATFFFDFLMKGTLDSVSGLYTIPKTILSHQQKDGVDQNVEDDDPMDDGEKRCFMYVPFVFHPGLQSIQYKTFFHLCRLKSISYDLESKTGTTFILLDTLQTGVMGIITIGRYRRNAVKSMNEAMAFIMSQAGNYEYKLPDPNGAMRADTMYLTDVASRVRLIHKVFEKKAAQNAKKI